MSKKISVQYDIKFTTKAAEILRNNDGDVQALFDSQFFGMASFQTQEASDPPNIISKHKLPALEPGPVKRAYDRLVARAGKAFDPCGCDAILSLYLSGSKTEIDTWVKEIREHHYVSSMVQILPFGHPSFDPGKNPNFKDQEYLSERVSDCKYGWRYQGGLGEHVRLCDIETAWDLKHPDLPCAHKIWGYNDHSDRAAVRHGNNALAVTCSLSNQLNGIGICPEMKEVSVASYATEPCECPQEQLFEAIVMATEHLVYSKSQEEDGNVLLLEVGADHGRLPVEIVERIHCAIRLAVANNVIVIEPAGNGGQRIDHLLPKKDSGAIIVGALDKDGMMLKTSSYGNRVDTFSWGQSVFCLEPASSGLPFEHTSAASAIVAGCVSMIQSIYKKDDPCQCISPSAMRDRLRSVSYDGCVPLPLNVKHAMAANPVIDPGPVIRDPVYTTHRAKLPQSNGHAPHTHIVWQPSLTPVCNPPLPGGVPDPLERGGPLPNYPSTICNGSDRFDKFVCELVKCIKAYNEALRKVKEGIRQGEYNCALQQYRCACKNYAHFIETTDLVDHDSIYIEPILSNGFVIDVRIIAHPHHEDGEFGEPNYHSESSFVSTSP